MGRSESKDAFNTSKQMAQQNQGNAQNALSATGSGLDAYGQNVNRFMGFGRRMYSPNGEFMRTQNTLANDVAAAGSRGIGGRLALNAMRTGANTANYAPTMAESSRAGSRDMTSFLANANSDRIRNSMALEQYGVDASKFPVEVQQQIYGTSLGGANNAMGNATNAAKTPGFWDQFLPAVVGAGGQVAAGFTPKGK